jgi:hypothetical protein
MQKRKKISEAVDKLLDVVDPKAKKENELFLPEDDDEGYESEEYYDPEAKVFKKKPKKQQPKKQRPKKKEVIGKRPKRIRKAPKRLTYG